MDKPKILIFDIETLPIMREMLKNYPRFSDYPGLTMKASVTSIICVGHKWLDDKQTNCISAWDFKGRWKKNVSDDLAVCKAAHKVLSQADVVITHNGKRFDWKHLQTRFMANGLRPLHEIPHIDTVLLARRNLLVFNNKLGTLGKFLVNDDKRDNGGWELWEKVFYRDPEACKEMVAYCKQDVNLLEKIFKKLLPFVKNMPNHNLFRRDGLEVCPNCGSYDLVKNGTQIMKNGWRQKHLCNGCGSTPYKKYISIKSDLKI